MEIREITLYDTRSPFDGYGIWIVLGESGRKAHLFHPVHLVELFLREYEFVKASGGTLYPINTTGTKFNKERFICNFKERISFFIQNGRSFPLNTATRILAELENYSLEDAQSFIGEASVNEYGESLSKLSTKANREYVIRDDVDPSQWRGRQQALLAAFKENGPSSILQITTLVEGKLKTKSSLSRVVTYFVNKLASEGVLEIVA